MRLSLLILTALVVAGPALAGPPACTDLLDRRVLDLRDTRRFAERTEHLRTVLCLPAFSDIEALRRLEGDTGGALGAALQAYGYRGDGLSWKLARDRLCSPKPRFEEAFKGNFVALRAADRGLMQAFNACLPGSQVVEVWVELGQGVDGGWLLSAFNRYPQLPRAPRFLALATAPRDLCTTESGFVPGQPIRDDRARCRYAPQGATSVTLTADGVLGRVTIEVPR